MLKNGGDPSSIASFGMAPLLWSAGRGHAKDRSKKNDKKRKIWYNEEFMRIFFVFHILLFCLSLSKFLTIIDYYLLTCKSALNFSWIVELTFKNRINLGLPLFTGLVEKVIMSVLNCSYARMSIRTLLERMVKARIYNSLIEKIL